MKFQVGDRVRVYGSDYPMDRKEGVVESISSYGMLFVHPFGASGPIEAHPKQCRKLVPRKRREWWVLIRLSDGVAVAVQDTPDFLNITLAYEAIHVREVKKK